MHDQIIMSGTHMVTRQQCHLIMSVNENNPAGHHNIMSDTTDNKTTVPLIMPTSDNNTVGHHNIMSGTTANKTAVSSDNVCQ